MNATPSSYGDFVASRLKPSEQILASLTPEKAQLAHLAMLLTSEAGEVASALKGHIAYEKPLAPLKENLIEELGDIEFALEALRQLLGISRELVLAYNRNKLEKRYPSGAFTNADAAARADKQ